VVFPFTRGGRPWPHPSIFGYGPEELSFFLGVAILWFVVGKLPDRRRSDKVSSEKRVTVREALISSFMIVLGIVMGIALFAEGLEGLRIPFRWGDYWGTIAESILFVVWSFALIFVSALTLTTVIRRVVWR
jgi:hypothetical protein